MDPPASPARRPTGRLRLADVLVGVGVCQVLALGLVFLAHPPGAGGAAASPSARSAPVPSSAASIGAPMLPEGPAASAAGPPREPAFERVEVQGEAPKATGELPMVELRRILGYGLPRSRWCYEAGLAREPRLAGRLALRLTIEPSGRVGQLAATGFPDAAVAACVVAAYQNLTFPAPVTGPVDVTYALVFSAS